MEPRCAGMCSACRALQERLTSWSQSDLVESTIICGFHYCLCSGSQVAAVFVILAPVPLACTGLLTHHPPPAAEVSYIRLLSPISPCAHASFLTPHASACHSSPCLALPAAGATRQHIRLLRSWTAMAQHPKLVASASNHQLHPQPTAP
jgi:hypothetical protein